MKRRKEAKVQAAQGSTRSFVRDMLDEARTFERILLQEEDDDVWPDDGGRCAAIWERHQAGTPDGVSWNDRAVGRPLRQRLQAAFERLLTEERADYHPGTGKVVRDLVHPSMYPYVARRSKLARGVVRPDAPAPPFDLWGRKFERSKYQWLPTPVSVGKTGGVRFDRYINNLDRNVYPEVYDALADLLTQAIPMFEQVVGYVRATPFMGGGVAEHELPSERPNAKAERRSPRERLRGRRLQVMTKMVEYQVGKKPFEGVWHVEGMSHERIIATAVYVLERDPALDGGEIQFKRAYSQREGGQMFWNIPQLRSREMNDVIARGALPNGTLGTPQGRLFVFPNSHIHRLTTMRAVGAPRARRRIVVFWLVDPERPILSTAELRPQQATWSRKDAEKIRLALMKERTFHKQSLNERAVSLCEH